MSDRPPGVPTHGWTFDGKIVKLSGKAILLNSPLKMVTREGWPAWYPTTSGEYQVKKSGKAKTNRGPLDFFGREHE